jgi:membrane associated rhomboid family serine protease
MIPLKDDISSSKFPLINTLLIAVNVVVFLFELGLGRNLNQFIMGVAVIPESLLFEGLPAWPKILYSMFLHAGWGHFLGNMLYLYIFGDNVEDALGHLKYAVFYLLCGFGAAWAHILAGPSSPLPAIGASGAIAGVLGAYLVLYPSAGVLTLVPLGFFIRIIKIPALVVLGFWIVLQIILGAASLPGGGREGGIAWFAHIGGFACGLLLVIIMGGLRKRQKYVAKSRRFWDN